MSEVKLPEPFGWKMTNSEYDYGITVYERYQVEDYLTQGWKIEETTFRTVQMEEYAEQRVREALAALMSTRTGKFPTHIQTMFEEMADPALKERMDAARKRLKDEINKP